MTDELCIQIDDALCGNEIVLDERVDSSLLQLSDHDELTAISEVLVCGKVYRADNWILVDARVSVSFSLPCAVCNEPFEYTVNLPKWVHEEVVRELSGGSWDIREPLREAILLEIPFFAQCGEGGCSNFDSVRKFIRSEEEMQTPFKDLLS